MQHFEYQKIGINSSNIEVKYSKNDFRRRVTAARFDRTPPSKKKDRHPFGTAWVFETIGNE
jgi:hypothetical protein